MAEQIILIDVYHPLVETDHEADCAALCTDYPGDVCIEREHTDGCRLPHGCWCPDGALTFEAFQAKHPDVTVAEA